MTTASVTALAGSHFDVAIVGGGINGAAAAQALSAAGYRVLLVEQADFASGATSRSSRLLHCGLRHLAPGSSLVEILLRPDRFLPVLASARDDMLARDELVGSIPGRLRAIEFCLPIYEGDAYGPLQMDLAFAALRLLSPGGVGLDYRRHPPARLQSVPIAPWLRDPGQLKSVAVFREYLFDWPERIALDALFDAARMGATVLNHTRVDQLQPPAGDRDWRLTLTSQIADTTVANERVQVGADLVLNLAGAWVDRVIGASGVAAKPRCAPIKGIHIAVRLPPEFNGWGLFAYNSIGEPLYCLPSNGAHYIGLTRRPFSGDAGGVVATDDEIDWMLAETNRCLPSLKLGRADVLYSWAGVNPLSIDPESPLGSREIKIHDLAADGLPGMLTLTGGPIMTHRRVAKRLLREVARRLEPSRPAQAPSYVSRHYAGETDNAAIEGDEFRIGLAEIARCAREESPADLVDLLQRRLGAGRCSDQGVSLARPVAQAAAVEMGWTPEDIEAQVQTYRQYLQAERRQPAK